MIGKTNAGNVLYVDTAVSRAAPVNLLDNSDFCNPVNQRGMSGSVSAYTYFIDRWQNATSEARSFSLLSNGMKMPAATTLLQLISSIPSGAKLTFAIELSNGDLGVLTGTTTYNSDSAWVRFTTAGFEDFELYLETMNGLVQAVVYSVNEITIKWAALYEGEYTADTLPEYHPKGYMMEALNCGALNVKTTATLSTSGWSSSAPYSQTISIEGMTATDTPHVSPVYSGTLATAIAQQEAWSAVNKAVAYEGKITFVCFEDKPTTDIPIQLEVNR